MTTVHVSLNGMDLEEGRDFYLLDEKVLRVVLRKPKPKVKRHSLFEKLFLVLTGQWGELTTPGGPHPDFVTLESWDAGWRESFFVGVADQPSEDRVADILYEEDVQEVDHEKDQASHPRRVSG